MATCPLVEILGDTVSQASLTTSGANLALTKITDTNIAEIQRVFNETDQTIFIEFVTGSGSTTTTTTGHPIDAGDTADFFVRATDTHVAMDVASNATGSIYFTPIRKAD